MKNSLDDSTRYLSRKKKSVNLKILKSKLSSLRNRKKNTEK